MERIRRNERLVVITRMLTESPNKIHTLSRFCERFGAAKSTMSEDIDILREVFEDFGIGQLDTITGAAGGVRFRPMMPHADARAFLEELCEQLSEPSRILPGGFLYVNDILSTPEITSKMGTIIAGEFYDAEPDFVLTMETMGVPVAMMTARNLGVPLVIARHTSKMYEGSSVNINYVSGSDHILTMSLNRRAVQAGQRCLIVDDFLKGGGTAKGMTDLMHEFDVSVVGSAFVLAKGKQATRLIQDERALLVMDTAPDGSIQIEPASWLD